MCHPVLVWKCSEAHICNDVDAELGEVGDHGDVLVLIGGDLRVLHQLREVLLVDAFLLGGKFKFKQKSLSNWYRVPQQFADLVGFSSV